MNEDLEKLVELFNSQFPVGSKVNWRSVGKDGVPFQEYTVELPARVQNDQPVAWFKERSAMVSIESRFVDYGNKPAELTDRQILDALVSTECQCGAKKKTRMSHCSKCYYKLPPEARQALYQKFGCGYEQSYRKSLEILNGK